VMYRASAAKMIVSDNDDGNMSIFDWKCFAEAKGSEATWS
jgi:hypothetical protein